MATASFTTHADRANLVTKPDDWASIDIDGTGLLKALEPSPGDIAIAKMGQPIHTTCCPSGTVEFIAGSNIGNNEKHNADDKSVSSSTPFPGSAAYEGCCDAVTATLRAMTTRMSTHAPKFLLLTGSLRADSCSRRVAVEAGRILASYGAEVKLFDPTDLPLFSQDVDPKTNAKVAELPALTRWCEGMVWVSPEVHGNFSAVFKNQIDWMPLTEGALRPTQGKTVAVMQVEAGSQSFNTVNNLRVLGRWMRMVVIPNQSSIPKAYTEFNEDGTLKEGLLRSRVVDVVDELFRYTLLLRDQQPLLLQRYSERTAIIAKKNIEATSKVADASLLKALKDPIIIDVRSEKEVAESKGGNAIPGSVHVPRWKSSECPSDNCTRVYNKLVDAGIDMGSLPNQKDTAFIVHCTKGNTNYTGRCNRGAALLRDLGYHNAHNGGSADEIRTALDLIKAQH